MKVDATPGGGVVDMHRIVGLRSIDKVPPSWIFGLLAAPPPSSSRLEEVLAE